EIERFLVAVAGFGETFAIRLRTFLRGAHDAARIFEERAVERSGRAITRALSAAESFKIAVGRQHFRDRLLGLLDPIVASQGGLELWISLHRVAQGFLPLLDQTPVRRVEERG